MSVLVGVETLLLVLLALLMVGLLRSHAEILRRLEELSGARVPDVPPSTAPSPDREDPAEILDLMGETPSGELVKIALAPSRGRTLLAFLSSGCTSCGNLWGGLQEGAGDRLPVEARLVVVTKGGDEESPSHLRELAPSDVPVVMCSEAWERYRVAGSPYFILFEQTGQIAGEGTATSWDQLASLLADAVGDTEPVLQLPEATHSGSSSNRGPARLARVDAELDAAGIGPGHASLYSAEPFVDETDER